MWRSLKYSIDILNLQLHRLTDDQAFSLKAALSGHNVFITGQAGTGKSFLVKEILQQLEQSGKNVAIISSTGISGTHNKDLKNPVPTVHSFYGIGTGDLPWQLRVQKASSNNLIQEQLRKVDCLIWDEASMTSGRTFEICNVIQLTVGGNTEHKLPFGGKQVVLVGEFLQLRPVPNQFDDGQFTFCSQLLGRAFPHPYQLFTEKIFTSLPAHDKICFMDKFFPSGSRQIFFGHEQIFHRGLLVGIKIVLLPSLGRAQWPRYACHGSNRLYLRLSVT